MGARFDFHDSTPTADLELAELIRIDSRELLRRPQQIGGKPGLSARGVEDGFEKHPTIGIELAKRG